VVPAQETEWSYKRASYGRLSTRHLGVEAGLGTLGLEVNILTPEYGPRLYLTGVLTELALAADRPMTERDQEAFELTPEIVALELGTLAEEFEASIKAPRIVDRRTLNSPP
jgi:hypothetical protein